MSFYPPHTHTLSSLSTGRSKAVPSGSLCIVFRFMYSPVLGGFWGKAVILRKVGCFVCVVILSFHKLLEVCTKNTDISQYNELTKSWISHYVEINSKFWFFCFFCKIQPVGTKFHLKDALLFQSYFHVPINNCMPQNYCLSWNQLDFIKMSVMAPRCLI